MYVKAIVTFNNRTTSEENYINNKTDVSESLYFTSTSLVLLNPYIYRGQKTYLSIYSAIVLAVIISTLVRAFVFFWYSLQIGINLHDKMFQSVVRAPIKFFDENPSGNFTFTKRYNLLTMIICDHIL